jgi:hypothetical protein
MRRKSILLSVVTVVATVFGWQLNNFASASPSSRRVCLSPYGVVALKSSCAVGETEIAAGKVRRTPIKKVLLRNGKTKLSASSVTSERVKILTDSSEQPLVSTLGSSVRSYTNVIGFKSDWVGSVSTACLPSELAIGVYATWFLDGKPIPKADGTQDIWVVQPNWIQLEPSAGGRQKVIDLYFWHGLSPVWGGNGKLLWEGGNTGKVTRFDLAGYHSFEVEPIPPTLTLYLTQLCAPLTTLEGVG